VTLHAPLSVTGASGFIGLNLVRRLASAGRVVRGLARAQRTARLIEEAGGQPVYGDLDDGPALDRLVEGAGAVIHLAGRVRALYPAELDRVNEGGTQALTRAMARRAPTARLVQVSSLAAAGPSSPDRPRNEADPPAPISHYGRSKRKAELVVEGSGLEWTIIRPAAVYGPGDKDFLFLFRLARRGIVPDLGRRLYSLIHVDDLVDALLLASTHPAAPNRALLITGPEDASLADFNRIISRHLDRPTRRIPVPDWAAWSFGALTQGVAGISRRAPLLGIDKVREVTAPSWRCSSELARHLLDYSPRIGLEAGLTSTCDWYRERGLL